MNPNNKHPQFIPSGVTGIELGNNVKIRTGSSQQRAATLMAIPAFPRDHSRWGRASPFRRLSRRQPIEMLYEASRAVRSRARMALRAAVEPMLMRERRTQTRRETMMALRGIADLG
jgi:hypothetical protein